MDPQTPNEPQNTETNEQKYARLYQQQQAQAPPQPVTVTLPPEVAATLAELKAGLEAVKESVKKPEPAAPQTPAPTTAEWVEKIRLGDYEGAEKVLTDKVLRGLTPQLEETRTRAYQEAMNATQINLEIDRHVQKVKLENPDLVQFERYMQAPIAQRIEEARQAGKIKTNADYLREYKAAVDAEVIEVRNLSLALRGQGKQEANTRNQQVIASTLLTPNQVQSTQTPEDQNGQPPDVSQEAYFAARYAQTNRGRGL